ncbi:hypothetical protein C0992_009520, partial [Termitomyces sp. T32_za158]
IIKTKWSIYGRIPSNPGILHINHEPIERVDTYKYVGIMFSRRSLFHEHYRAKAEKAQRIANVSFAVQTHVGVIPPYEGKRLYMARVDPHLVFGCEVVLDVVTSSLRLLEDVQVAYCRRLLGLTSRCTLVPLFTETGILPLNYRRVVLATKYLSYLLSLPPTHYASSALRDSIALAQAHQPSWTADLAAVLDALSTPACLAQRVPTPVQLHWDDLSSSIAAAQLEERIVSACHNGLQQVVNAAVRLRLLRTRHSFPPAPSICQFRPYLSIPTPAHRKALTRLIVSDHPLGIERLRHGDRRRPQGVPRHLRLCRFWIVERPFAIDWPPAILP